MIRRKPLTTEAIATDIKNGMNREFGEAGKRIGVSQIFINNLTAVKA